jgi:hypothetical protein
MFSLSAFNSELFLNAFDNADEKVSAFTFELIRKDPKILLKFFSFAFIYCRIYLMVTV